MCGLQECAVCGEKFDEYFDEEHDEWRFRNAVVIENTVSLEATRIFLRKSNIFKIAYLPQNGEFFLYDQQNIEKKHVRVQAYHKGCAADATLHLKDEQVDSDNAAGSPSVVGQTDAIKKEVLNF